MNNAASPRRKIFDLDVRLRARGVSPVTQTSYYHFLQLEPRESRAPPEGGIYSARRAEISASDQPGIRAFRSCNSHGMRNQSDFARYIATSPAWTNARAISARRACIPDCGGASFSRCVYIAPANGGIKVAYIDRRDGCETSKKSSGVAVVRLVRTPAAGRVLRLRS